MTLMLVIASYQSARVGWIESAPRAASQLESRPTASGS